MINPENVNSAEINYFSNSIVLYNENDDCIVEMYYYDKEEFLRATEEVKDLYDNTEVIPDDKLITKYIMNKASKTA